MSIKSTYLKNMSIKSCFAGMYVYPVHAVDMFFVLVRESFCFTSLYLTLFEQNIGERQFRVLR